MSRKKGQKYLPSHFLMPATMPPELPGLEDFLDDFG
jgi:hypothetical protein